MKKIILASYFLFIALSELFSQNLPYYFAANNLSVYAANGKLLQYPFTGGLKHPLFGMIDLNGDGFEDLIVLDRMDDRILTYRNIGIKDSIGFVYRPQYEMLIPDTIAKTIIIKDYNNDEKPDLFAFANTKGVGLQVYKNTSSATQIKFELVANPVKASSYGFPESDIYVSSDDIPAIEDMDGDGDLDILTFSIAQGYVDYYKNQSQELYQHSDSLKFLLADDCWGKFFEGDSSNRLTLHIKPTDCYVIDHINHIISRHFNENERGGPTRHAGSTMMANDMDDDGDIDIILGDIAYPGMIQLTNGKSEYSHPRDSIIIFDTSFPKGTKPVQVRQMPGMFYIDLDNDSIKDMVVSPMDNNLPDTIDGLNQVWLYKNQGQNQDPKFSFIKKDFLQEQMIDLGGPTQPVFFDYDHDGDNDLFVVTKGNYVQTQHNSDRIVLYENTGNSAKAEFRFRNNDYLGLSSRKYLTLTLAFGDIDGDQKPDMILGKKDGTISFYKNITVGNDTSRFQWITDYLDSIDVGSFSAPFVFDMNNDKYGELFIGQDHGEIWYYLNNGNSSQPSFKLITPAFGGITFKSQNHYTSPYIGDLNKNGLPELVFAHNYWDPAMGLVVGDIGFVEDINNDTSKKYQPVYNRIKDPYSQKIISKNPGRLLRPAFCDLDGDTWPDMMLGSSRGGLMLLTTLRDTLTIGIDDHLKIRNAEIKVFPNPATDILHIDLKELGGYYHIDLTDITGRSVMNTVCSGGSIIELNVSDVQSGFYVIRVKDLKSETICNKKVLIN